MFWRFCTGYVILITLAGIYSAVFVDPLAATDLGKTSCIAMVYAASIKYCFPALDAWRAHKQQREVVKS